MKILKNICLSVALLAVVSSHAVSQEAEYRKFGMGVSFTPFDMTAVSGGLSVMPVTGINFVYNATGSFRSELSLGIVSVDNKTDNETTSMTSGGLGLFYTRRVSSSVLMGGVRIEYLTGLAESEYGMGQKVESDIKRISFGPAVSYEYLFSKHFGLGAEVGLKSSNYTETMSMTGMDDEEFEVSSFFIDNLIFVRGYF